MFWGPISQVEVLNVGALDIKSKPLFPQTVAGSSEFLSNCVTVLGVEFMARWCLSFFNPFQCGFFSFIWYVRFTQRVFRFLGSENYSVPTHTGNKRKLKEKFGWNTVSWRMEKESSALLPLIFICSGHLRPLFCQSRRSCHVSPQTKTEVPLRLPLGSGGFKFHL